MRRYRTVFTRDALNFVVQMDEAASGEIVSWVDVIVRVPATRGDHTEQDDGGRELRGRVADCGNYLLDRWWVREVRVLGIEAF